MNPEFDEEKVNLDLFPEVTPELLRMNREERRKLEQDQKRLKKKENKVVKHMVENHEGKLKELDKPATIAEVVQIATSVVNDSINEYHKQSNPIIVSLSIHMEILKKKFVEKGLTTEDEFDSLFENSIAEFNALRKEKLAEMAEQNIPSSGSNVEFSVGDEEDTDSTDANLEK